MKTCAKEFASPLLVSFKRSLNVGLIPMQWKDANVSPIFKKGSRLIASNYRPVSLTSVICKVMESIVRDVFMGHLVSKGLLARDTDLSKKSCVTNLFESLDFISSSTASDMSNVIDAIYLDFSKAFDTVPHERLLLKIQAYGVADDLLS